MSPRDPSTRGSLLLRLRDVGDVDSWNEFVACYAPKIYGWCRGNGLQENDAADATQTVLCKLVQTMRRFDYDPRLGRFRGWLKTVAQHVAQDVRREWGARGRGSGDTTSNLKLQALEAPDVWAELAYEIEATHREELLRVASRHVRLRVKHNTWEAYRLTAIEGRAPIEVATELSMTVSDVYVSKSRVLKLLREEVAQLDPEATS